MPRRPRLRPPRPTTDVSPNDDTGVSESNSRVMNEQSRGNKGPVDMLKQVRTQYGSFVGPETYWVEPERQCTVRQLAGPVVPSGSPPLG